MHTAVAHLQAQLRDLQRNPVGGFAVDIGDDGDLFKWQIHFAGPEGSVYYPGIYKAEMKFPQDFPFKPPTLRVISKFWHPNVYSKPEEFQGRTHGSGDVCMSTLHQTGADATTDMLESAMEQYTPIVTMEKILIAFISLLSEPDPKGAGAPANVDALAMYRNNKEKFIEICKENAKKSLEELPKDFKMPEPKDLAKQQQAMMRVVSSDAYDYEDSAPSSQPTASSSQPDPTSANNNNNNKAAPNYADQLKRIKDIVPDPPKSDEELLKMLEKYRGDVDRVMEGLWD